MHDEAETADTFPLAPLRIPVKEPTPRLVVEAEAVSMRVVACRVVAVMFVEETFAREDEAEVNTPVEEEIVIRADEVAPPPSFPESTCESTPAERNVSDPPAVEVTYLFPLKSVKNPPATCRLPVKFIFVPLALVNLRIGKIP